MLIVCWDHHSDSPENTGTFDGELMLSLLIRFRLWGVGIGLLLTPDLQ